MKHPIEVVGTARSVGHWLFLAVGVLVIAGLFAIALVVARMPPFDRLVGDPLLFRRCLVVHVNLALVFWFYSFIGALLFLLPRRGPPGALATRAVWFGGAGVLAMVVSAGMPGATPVLSNYIPTIDHWLFSCGQVLFAAGVLASFADRRLIPGQSERRGFVDIPAGAIPGLRATGIALIVAALTFLGAWLKTPSELPAVTYYEVVMWGGGHVLQLASAMAMISVWLILLSSALGREIVSRRASFALFAVMLLPWLLAPRLSMMGTLSWHYRNGFTDLMRWGIFPMTLVFLGLCTRALWRSRREGALGWRALADYRITGFGVSAGLTLLGFVLGAMIRGSNTMVPAHYHASIGGVTAAFMAVTFLLLAPLGFAIPTPRLRTLASVQPLVFGLGQMVFAAGFALAGAHGMERKTYGAEQVGRSAAQTVGLATMGIGGLVAVAGGILFLFICIYSWRARLASTPGRSAWPTNPNPSTRVTSQAIPESHGSSV